MALRSSTAMLAANSSSFSARAAITSSELDVTPPLLADASLKTTTPAFSITRRASCVKNRLAPSTTYLKRRLRPSSSEYRNVRTLSSGTAAGRPPQGTKKSPTAMGLRWKWLRNSMPFSTTVPSGSTASLSSTSTRKPLALSLDLLISLTILRARARRLSSALLMPSGSKSTPLPSTTAKVRSLPSRISLLPRSPSGPPVCILSSLLPSRPSLRWMPVTKARTLRVVMP
mmetsp:Transcript_23172/g.65117  ORF Transcript_23172/g.65117 Transcript_23172/m.65117 type:complete len:229 (+) Transcript_23172:595-1281(+)